MDKVRICVENAKDRILNPKHKMNYSKYITYFVKKHDLTIADDEEIRKQIKQFIDENVSSLFPVTCTINGKEI